MRIRNAQELGKELKNRRKSLGFTQADISERTGLSASFISEVENGKETAELGKVMLLISILGINIYVEER